MDQKLLDFIKLLTARDTKTLSQKALKTAEECGELAKVVLPYDGAHATTHRFIDSKRILEEVADVFLCATSIAYHLGFDDSDIEQMIGKKAEVWAELQDREDEAKYPIPYEIHVTVEEADVEHFRAVCAELQVKPIVLDLHLHQGGVIKDIMTSSKFYGDNRGAFEYMKGISAGLTKAGLKVVREKIETVPWCPAAPSEKHSTYYMPPGCYFECHFGVLVHNDDELERLKGKAVDLNAHLSKNVFKRFEDGSYVIMFTYRDYATTRENFRRNIDTIKEVLATNQLTVEREVIEFSIYDTKVTHDSQWLQR